MEKLRISLISVISALAIAMVLAANSLAADVPRMTKEELKALLGNADVVIIDGRSPRHWNYSDSKIVGAVRENSYAALPWAGKHAKDKTIVIYCD